jgi:hypothetical protein
VEIELIDLDGHSRPAPPAEADTAERRRRVPPRVRTTALVAVAVGVALLVITGIAVSARRAQLEADLDQTLDQQATDLEARVVADPLTPSLDPAVVGDGRFAQVVQSPGVVVASTPDLDPEDPLPMGFPPRGGTSWTTAEATVAGRVEKVRVAARALVTPQGVASSTVVAVGARLDTVDDSLATFRAVLLVLTALLVGAAAATTWALTGRRRPDRGTGPAANEGQMS